MTMQRKAILMLLTLFRFTPYVPALLPFSRIINKLPSIPLARRQCRRHGLRRNAFPNYPAGQRFQRLYNLYSVRLEKFQCSCASLFRHSFKAFSIQVFQSICIYSAKTRLNLLITMVRSN